MDPTIVLAAVFKVISMTLTEAKLQNTITPEQMHTLAQRMDQLLAAVFSQKAVIFDKDHVEIMSLEEGEEWLRTHNNADVITDDEPGGRVLKIGDDL